MREEIEGLEDHPHLGSQLCERSSLLGQRNPVDLDLTLLDRLQAVDGTAQGRLARAGGTDDCNDLATVDVERDVVESLEAAVVLGDVADAHQYIAVNGALDVVRRVCGCLA